ncbi:MAG TPA: hypothetical protein DCW60_03615 [Sutterella sp.]|nr:hypothetical protein [Sutterella sp.]
MTLSFQNLFLMALIFYFAFQSIVCVVEIFHLRLTRNKIPEEFADIITPAAHFKAAAYDISRTKLNLLEVTCVTIVIGVLTLYDGINVISNLLMNMVGDTFAFHWMLPSIIGLIFIILDFPFTWYREFRLPEAFGYCRIGPRHWLNEQLCFSLLGWLSVLPVLWFTLWIWRHTENVWWVIGWFVCSIYLVFSLGLARRIVYLFKKKKSTPLGNASEIVEILRKFNHSLIRSIRVTDPADDRELPPAFAFGNHRNLHLFIRHDIAQNATRSHLLMICAHAMARNRTHMYFQSWLLCSIVAFGVFLFLDWFAPQSWFLDEIGFQAYGPGPYYGLLLSFCIVVLPVLFFPIKLLIDVFFRHQIYKSDTEVLKFLGLETVIDGLLALVPKQMRHSVCSLSIFDLLFSHEPSLLSRIRTARLNALRWQTAQERAATHATWNTISQQKENVALGLSHRRLTEAFKDKLIRAKLQEETNREAQKAQLAAFENKPRKEVAFGPEPEIVYDDTDNTKDRLYGMSLTEGVRDLIARFKAYLKARQAARANARQGAPKSKTKKKAAKNTSGTQNP